MLAIITKMTLTQVNVQNNFHILSLMSQLTDIIIYLFNRVC